MKKKSDKLGFVYSFVLGLGVYLFVSTPLGLLGIFDGICLIIGPILLLINWNKFEKREQRFILLVFLWMLGLLVSDLYRGSYIQVLIKGQAIVLSACMMLVVMLCCFRNMTVPRYFAFIMGYTLSAVISIHLPYFATTALAAVMEVAESGAYREDFQQTYNKVTYAKYAYMIFYLVLYPLSRFKFFPLPLAGMFSILCGVFLLFSGGSRTNFAIFVASGVAMIASSISPRILLSVRKHWLLFLFPALCLFAVIYVSYTHLARTGQLGEREYDKYMREMGDREGVECVLGSRNDIIRAWPYLSNSPLIGAGTIPLDRWGYTDRDVLPQHSCIVGPWVKAGVCGLIFWVYTLCLVIKFTARHLFTMGRDGLMLLPTILYLLWNILFSGFDGNRGMFIGGFAFVIEYLRQQELIKRNRIIFYEKC